MFPVYSLECSTKAGISLVCIVHGSVPSSLKRLQHLVGEQSIFSELSLLHIRHYDGAGVAVQKRCLSFRVQSLVGGPEGRHGNRWV